MERIELLNKINTGITTKDPKAEVYLYGSRARGDNHKDSDWDILVISSKDKITFDYELDLRDPIVDIELESGEIISLLVYTKSYRLNQLAHSPLFSNVKKEGIKI